MRRRKYILGISLLLAVTAAGILLAQRHERQRPSPPPFHEETASVELPAAAPPECVQQVRQFIQYVFLQKPDIATDSAAQQRFLSDKMRRAFANRQAVYTEYAKKNDTPDLPPNNSTFVGAWDYPTSFKIVGSRRYDQRAVVDVVFTWGENTNYEGDTRLDAYYMVWEKDAWKLEDIYTAEGAFVGAGSLIEIFRREKY